MKTEPKALKAGVQYAWRRAVIRGNSSFIHECQ
jgi:hypothetical protein